MLKLSIMVPVYNQEKLVITALESIPKRKDIEVLIIDDCSTDGTWKSILEGEASHAKDFGNVVLKQNSQNKGCGFSKNWAYSNAQGEYIITLDSDDYFYTKEFNEALDKLYSTESDLVFIANRVNDGSVWSDNTRKATGSYFLKRSFLEASGLNYRADARRAGDWELTKALQKLPHQEERWPAVAYHYNYPRQGSIVGNGEHRGR